MSETLVVPPRLEEIREAIDRGDAALVAWLVCRAVLVKEAAEIKKAEGLPQHDEDRERLLRLEWSRAAGRALEGTDRAMAVRPGFWIGLGFVFDSILDFCDRQRG